MSMVGPRPERPHFVRQFVLDVPGYDRRLLDVRPGLTGLACVYCGPDQGLRDVRRKVKLDLVYVRRMCWLVDFRIMIKTLRFLAGRPYRARRAGAVS